MEVQHDTAAAATTATAAAEEEAVSILFEKEEAGEGAGAMTRSRRLKLMDNTKEDGSGTKQEQGGDQESDGDEGEEELDSSALELSETTEDTVDDGAKTTHRIDAEITHHATIKNRASVIIESDIPDVCKTEPCVLGIDEAGRGRLEC